MRSVVERLDENVDHDRYRVWLAAYDATAPTPAERLLAEMEARKLARRDGELHAAAWNRALGIEDPHVRHILSEWTALDWAAEDPRAALVALDSLPWDDMVLTVGSGWIQPLQRRIRGRIIERWADSDPDATLAWVLEQQDGFYVQAPMIAFARRSPEDAIARLATIPESLRESATGAVLRTIAYHDLDRALEWFATLDIGSKARHTWSLRRLLIERRSPEGPSAGPCPWIIESAPGKSAG